MEPSLGPSARPFLRWAGSKRWLTPLLRQVELPPSGTYYEPFLGSGAVYFALAVGHRSHLSDVLSPLINCYTQVRDDAELVGKIASQWDTTRDAYYEVRAEDFSDDPVRSAARFLYLNRLCFNALYRENRNGKFNVPYGRPRETNEVVDLPTLRAAGESLTRAETTLAAEDFEAALDRCTEGDFAFVDPPYALSKTRQSFSEYHSSLFSWEDQIRLSACVRRAANRGAKIIVTNVSDPAVRELYRGLAIQTLSRHSSMSGSRGGRRNNLELLVTAGLEVTV